VVYREETLLNVIRSVTRNGRSIILTAVLALILVYMFSIIGYMFFRDDFLVPIDEEPGQGKTIKTSEIADHNFFNLKYILVPCLASLQTENPSSHMVPPTDNPEYIPEVCRAPLNEKTGGENKENEGGEAKERACDSLLMCIVTTMNQGLRNGGGIGDILRAPSSKVRKDYRKVNLEKY
jgi:inositol 1,4,5-triphosphate receptor type 1